MRRSIARSRFLAVRSPGLEWLGTLEISCHLGRVAPLRPPGTLPSRHVRGIRPVANRRLRRGPVSVCRGSGRGRPRRRRGALHDVVDSIIPGERSEGYAWKACMLSSVNLSAVDPMLLLQGPPGSPYVGMGEIIRETAPLGGKGPLPGRRGRAAPRRGPIERMGSRGCGVGKCHVLRTQLESRWDQIDSA